jgi:Mg2+/Co2+ transporter CorB
LEEGLEQLDDHTWIIGGHISLHHLKKKFDWDLPPFQATRISGALIEHLECIPHPHTAILFGNCVFEILEVSENKILRIKVIKLDAMTKGSDREETAFSSDR